MLITIVELEGFHHEPNVPLNETNQQPTYRGAVFTIAPLIDVRKPN